MKPAPLLLRACLALLPPLLAPPAAVAATPARPNEIIVSSANYAQTPPDVLARVFRERAELTDAPPPPPTSAPPLRRYQFLPGEKLETDLDYLAVCRLLRPVLAQKNLVNTHDESQVDLILRVTFGSRRWRDPFVRKDQLEWRHGLVPRKRGAGFNAAGTWDDRAGGDEAALLQIERDLTEMNPTGGAEGMADRLIGGLPTEDYFLVVVDAFELTGLKQLGNKTPRAWTTFIAVPRQAGVQFSDVAAAMIAKAAPWFGETLPGKVRFTDREGTVKAGELRIVDDNAPAPKR